MITQKEANHASPAAAASPAPARDVGDDKTDARGNEDADIVEEIVNRTTDENEDVRPEEVEGQEGEHSMEEIPEERNEHTDNAEQ